MLFRVGGCEAKQHYGGSFRTKTEALERRWWIDGELAAMRVPDLSVLNVDPVKAPTVAEAAARWQESHVDVAPSYSASASKRRPCRRAHPRRKTRRHCHGRRRR